MTIMKEIKNDDGVLRIIYDEVSESPREFENLGKMVCFHRDYRLGDSHENESSDFNSWNDFKKSIMKKYGRENVPVILPLYIYDHSGISMSTEPFSCPWDSGQVGFIFATKEDIRNNIGVKNVTKKVVEIAKKSLLDEVNLYDDYLKGNVYGFQLENSEGEEVDSCWGFIGDEGIRDIANYIPEELSSLKRDLLKMY